MTLPSSAPDAMSDPNRPIPAPASPGALPESLAPVGSTAGLQTLFDRPSAPGREPRSYLPTLALANFGIYVALLTPVMVSMTFKVQHITADTGAATAALGTVLGIGALFALVSNPLVGRLSDRTTSRFGMRRPWIVGGSIVGFLALVGVGLAPNVLLLGAAWCIAQAAMNAVLAAANATLADQVPAQRRGNVSGWVGIATPLAILGGSLLVSFFADDLLRFAVPAALGLVLALVFAARLHDATLPAKPAEPFGVKQFLGSFAFDPRKHPDFGWTWLTKFFVMFGYAGIATFLPMFLAEKFALGEAAIIGVILAANTASTLAMAISSPLGGWLSDKLDNRRLFVALAGGIMVIGLVLLAFAPSVAIVLVAQAIIGLGAGSFFSVDLALATQVLPNKDDTAKDLGVLNIANALPQSIAPALAPAIIAIGSTTALGGYTTWYLFGALIALAGAVLVYRIKGVR